MFTGAIRAETTSFLADAAWGSGACHQGRVHQRFPKHRCHPARGKQAGSEWSDESAPWEQTEAEIRGPVLGRWLWGALPQLGGKRMAIEMRVFVNQSRRLSLEEVWPLP